MQNNPSIYICRKSFIVALKSNNQHGMLINVNDIKYWLNFGVFVYNVNTN